MIVTLTPNPSLDLLFAADRLVWDDANRLPMPRRRPGGQGINVVRAARALDARAAARAIAPLGGPVGRELREMLDAEGTPLTAVPIDGPTRVFVGVREAGTGRSLLLNPRGPEVTDDEAEAILEAVGRAVGAGAEPAGAAAGPGGDPAPTDPGPIWFAACGSLLPGLPQDFYAEAGRLARRAGARFVPDGDGDALAAAVPEADLLVPNRREAERLTDRPVAGPRDVVELARTLLDRGPTRVVVTLGADGAVAADDAGAWWARAVPPEARRPALAGASAVGAGDAFLAGLLGALEVGSDTGDAVAEAVAVGTAALLSGGTDIVAPEDAEEVREWVALERVATGA